jgi:hypothetical protein
MFNWSTPHRGRPPLDVAGVQAVGASADNDEHHPRGAGIKPHCHPAQAGRFGQQGTLGAYW